MKQILKYILSVNLDNLRFSETKHSVSIVLASAIIVFSATKITNELTIPTVFGIASIIFCALSIFASFSALSSRSITLKSSKRKKEDDDSLLYFNDIADFSTEKYIEEIIKNYDLPKTYKPDGFDMDLAKQIIATSRIARRKFLLFNIALFLLSFGICFVVVSFAVGGAL